MIRLASSGPRGARRDVAASALVAILSAQTLACSFAFIPSNGERRQPITYGTPFQERPCKRRVAPIVDTVFAGTAGLMGLGYGIASVEERRNGGPTDYDPLPTAIVSLGLAAAFAASAHAGYVRVARCSSYHAQPGWYEPVVPSSSVSP